MECKLTGIFGKDREETYEEEISDQTQRISVCRVPYASVTLPRRNGVGSDRNKAL